MRGERSNRRRHRRGDKIEHYMTKPIVERVGCSNPRSIGQNLQPFTVNGDVSIWVKILSWDEKPQTDKFIVENG